MTAKLDNWVLVWNQGYLCLHGNAYDHPDMPGGREITTSPVKSVANGQAVCSSRTYILGQPWRRETLWSRLVRWWAIRKLMRTLANRG